MLEPGFESGLCTFKGDTVLWHWTISVRLMSEESSDGSPDKVPWSRWNLSWVLGRVGRVLPNVQRQRQDCSWKWYLWKCQSCGHWMDQFGRDGWSMLITFFLTDYITHLQKFLGIHRQLRYNSCPSRSFIICCSWRGKQTYPWTRDYNRVIWAFWGVDKVLRGCRGALQQSVVVWCVCEGTVERIVKSRLEEEMNLV